MPKTYADTYLYSKYSEYEKKIFTFIMTATELDKNSPEFADITYDVNRRRVSSALVNILKSKSVVLMTAADGKGMTRPFKVFSAKDIKGTNKNARKVYIDCTGVIVKNEGGTYECKNIDQFISYLVSAMHTFIYYADEKRLVDNNKLMQSGASAFSALFTHVVDYTSKISINTGMRDKCIYLSCLYYFGNILEKDYTTPGCGNIARKISGISEREANALDILIKPEMMNNIKFFVEGVSDILRLSKLTLDVVLERWMFIYGTGTPFALELFPALASMITDAYVGGYVNNQKTIEKVIGTSMNEFTKTILAIGADSV